MDQSCQTSLPSIPRQRQQQQPQQTTLSRIESLPSELLERIFLHSLCINLPRSSIHIARILSKRIIYKWLIRLAFSSTNPSSEHGIFTEDFLPAPLDFWALSTTKRKSLQESILECRWSTLDLFRECQKEYVLHVLRRKTQDLVYTSEADQIAFDGISDYFVQLMRWDRAEQGRRGSGDLILKARRIVVESPASPSTASSTTQDHGLDKRVAIWFHFGAVQIRDPSVFYHEIDLFRLPCPPALNERPRMPDKVLRPPWTEEKLEFLTLLSQETYLDEHNHSSERSYQVLRQLIRDRDFETFARLLELNVTAKDYSYPQKWPVKTRHFKEALRLAQGPNDPFLNLLYNNHLGSLQDRKLREMIVNRLEI